MHLTLFVLAAILGMAPMAAPTGEPTYLPDATGAQTVTVTKEGPAGAGVTVLTQAVAINETGPKETVARFGEVYTFAPAFIAVHREQPTLISFRNLQPDDDHDFMLADPRANVVMKVMLPALRATSFVFTFHQEGIYNFYCTMHQPAMSGQILVLPPVRP